MNKSVFILLLVIFTFGCSEKKKETTFEVTTLSKLEKSPSQPVSVADVAGKDIADVKMSDITSEDNKESSTESKRNNTDKVTPTVIKKKIIKDGNIGLQVNNLQKAKRNVDSLVKSAGGYYASENLENSEQNSGYQLTIRIPVTNFDKFVNSVESGSDKVLSKVITARDVTEEFVDLETRLNSKRNSLARYNEILRKATTVKDIVVIEESIRVLQEEIESTEGKLRYLNDCVDYSTLNLTISTEKDFTFKPVKRDNFIEKLKESLASGWFGVIDTILFIFDLWPVWIILTGLFFLVRQIIKKRKQRKIKN